MTKSIWEAPEQPKCLSLKSKLEASSIENSKNYRCSKPAVWEHCSQTKYNMLDKFHFGFLRARSTETALLRVSSDIFMQSNEGECSVFLMLDLTSLIMVTIIFCLIGWITWRLYLDLLWSSLHHICLNYASLWLFLSKFSSSSLTYDVLQGPVLLPL